MTPCIRACKSVLVCALHGSDMRGAVAGCGVWRILNTSRISAHHPRMMALPTFGQGGASRSGQARSGCRAVRPSQASASARRMRTPSRWRPQTAAPTFLTSGIWLSLYRWALLLLHRMSPSTPV